MPDGTSEQDIDYSDIPVPALLRLLSDLDGGVREKARHALVARGPAIIDQLEPFVSSPNERERWEAAKTLAQLRDPRTASLLAEVMDDDRFDVHWIATEGLIHLGDDAVPAVLHKLVEKAHSVRVREGANRVLGEVLRSLPFTEKRAEVVKEVLETLHGFHPVEEVAEKAYEAVRALDD